MRRPEMLSSVQGRIREILIVLPGIPNEMSVKEYEKIVEVFDRKGTVYRFQLDVPDFKMEKEPRSRGIDPDPGHGEKVTYRGATYRYIEEVKTKFNWTRLVDSWQEELKELQSGEEPLYFERWAQDPFITLCWNEATILLKSTFNSRMCDFALPFEIATQGGKLIFVKPTELYLEGGNLLRGLDAVFVGSDTVENNRRRLGISRWEVKQKLAETLGVDEIIEIGSPAPAKPDPHPLLVYRDGSSSRTKQPIFHIDVFMNVGGRSIRDDREVIFLANTQCSRDLLQPTELRRVQRVMRELPPHDPFAQIRRNFDSDRFEVVDLPIFLREEIWYSWNNCLVEVQGNHRHVFLPSYIVQDDDKDDEKLNSTFRILEAEVARIYTKCGFGITWIRDGKFFRRIARWGGSLHCVTKVLRRDTSPFD